MNWSVFLRGLLFIIRLPPTSTLFPYTTLFRSNGDSTVEANESFTVTLSNAATATRTQIVTATASGTVNNEDRTTTHLNSTHGKKSYAAITFNETLTNPFDIAVTVPLTLADVTT